ncbi:MAG: hypothetical protein F6K19_16460 [Cyanothece sp. SIO1E1]|nr:hypothetical protein [Cyanothece sp. SIO1E1]
MNSKVFWLLIITMLLFSNSCELANTIRFYDNDREQCLTVWNAGAVKYLIIGEELFLVGEYVKLDVGHLNLEQQNIFVCWQRATKPLEIVVPKAKILENKLDSTQSRIYTPLNYLSQTSEVLRFHQEGCFEFNFESTTILPADHVLLEH